MTDPITRRSALVVLASLAAGCRVPVSRSSPDAPSQAASPDITSSMDIAGVPGVAMAMVSGTSVQARGLGLTRATEGRAVDADTIFDAASLSKAVFAYLVMQLVAERALDLDRPLREYVPLPLLRLWYRSERRQSNCAADRLF